MSETETSEAAESTESMSDAEKVQRFSRQSTWHSWIAYLLLPVITVAFMAGLIGLGTLHKSTQILLADKPATPFQLFAKKIDETKAAARSQYEPYHQQMVDDSVAKNSRRLLALYQLSAAAESDYVKFLESYQALSFEMAGRVKGSGEWYFYFNQSFNGYLATAKTRQAQLAAFIE